MIKLFKKFGFTKSDLFVIGFLLTTFAVGLVVKLSGREISRDFDYSAQDSNFEQHLKSSYSKVELSASKQERLNSMQNISDSLLNESDKPERGTLEGLTPGRKIDLNTAYPADLELLPGIGKVMAERIAEFRERNGGFTKVEDIMQVKGIGKKKFEKIKEYITVGKNGTE